MNSSISTPLYAGLYAAALQRFWIKEDDFNRNLMFAVAAAAGVYGGQMFVHPMLKKLYLRSLSPQLYNSRDMIERAGDVGVSLATAWALQKYVLGGIRYGDETMLHVYALLASHIAAVYTTQYMESRALSYLTSDDI